MKYTIRLLMLPVALFLAAGLSAATVKVTSEKADKLTDIRLSNTTEEASLKVVLDALKEGLERSAKRNLSDDQTLEIHFNDIDLAGEFEPWRSGMQYDVRWVKDIYIPRLEFTYKITGSDNTVVAEGSEKLADLTFMMRINPLLRDEIARYEVQMLSDWMRQFRKKDKG